MISDYVKSYKNQKFYIDNQSRELKVYDAEDIIQDNSFSFFDSFDINKISPNIVRVALNKKPFYYFSNLKKYFPNLKSMQEFISDSSYLGDVKFIFHSTNQFIINDKIKIEYIFRDKFGILFQVVYK